MRLTLSTWQFQDVGATWRQILPGRINMLVNFSGATKSVTVMLVTLWWWLISDVGGRIIMLATFFVMLVIFQCIKSVTNILNRSPRSQTCHQQIWSPTSVTNIHVTPKSLIGHERPKLVANINCLQHCHQKWYRVKLDYKHDHLSANWVIHNE